MIDILRPLTPEEEEYGFFLAQTWDLSVSDRKAMADCREGARFEEDPDDSPYSDAGATLQEGGTVDWAAVHALAAEGRVGG